MRCRYCGAEIIPGAAFCGNCGENLIFQDDPPPASTSRIPVVGSYVQPPASDPVAGVVGRIVGIYAIVGLGVAGAVLLFLWVLGFFHRQAASVADIGEAIVGGLAIVVALVFALLISFVLAAIAAHYASLRLAERDGAVVAAGIGAAVGHCVLIVCIAFVIIGGVNLFSSSGSPAPTPTPFASSDTASCRQTFGANSPLCGGAPTTTAITKTSNSIEYGTIFKGCIGAIPAALVGAFGAMVLFDRRRR
jgi:hypothetical protein